MKPSTKKRRRAQRGRPRDENAERTASGRKSRASTPKEDPRMVALDARVRRYGVSREVATQPYVGSAVGRLWLAQTITTPMREAGEKYLELHDAAMRALKAPVSLKVTNLAGDGGDVVTEEYEEWALKSVANYEVMKSALEDIRAEATVHLVAVLDEDPREFMLPALTDGLKLLAVKLGLESKTENEANH